MPKALHLSPVPPNAALWQAYDPASKTELFSSALVLEKDSLVCVDPIELAPAPATELFQLGKPDAILVTNENHTRAARLWSEQFQVPIFIRDHESEPGAQPASALANRFPGISIIQIDGGPRGELALFSPDAGGTLIVGDALIHFEPYGLALLPKKYCQNQKEMRASLHQLLQLRFERIFFAHGLPILRDASSRLQALLNE